MDQYSWTIGKYFWTKLWLGCFSSRQAEGSKKSHTASIESRMGS